MNKSVIAYYAEKGKKYSDELSSVTKKISGFAWFRFCAFILIFIPFFIFGFKSWIALGLSVSALVLFFFLIKKNLELDKKKKKFEKNFIAEKEKNSIGIPD